MAVSAFLDPGHPPDEAEVAAALGVRAPSWAVLAGFVAGPCGATTTWVNEGRSTGWALRAVCAGRSFAVLHTEPDVAAIRIVIGEKDRDATFALSLGERIGATI